MPISHVRGIIAATSLLLATSAPAFADPNSALMNAVIATSQARSYHISMSSPNMSAQGDIVNPGKMHMVMKDGETIIIRPDMYMKMGGKWKKITGVGDTMDQSDAVKQMQLHRADYTSQDLGMRTIGGAPEHAYLVTNLKKNSKETVYVDGSGRIAGFQFGDTTMTFSKYGEAVSIVAPM
jgi:hypothetical protein